MSRALFLALVFVGCASAQVRPARSLLAAKEIGAVGAVREKDDGGFRRFWRATGVARPGLIKWAPDASLAVQTAPGGMLEAVRDELGRLNQNERDGSDVAVAVNIYRYEKPWFRPVQVDVEIVGRLPSGQLAWAGLHTVTPAKEPVVNAADSDGVIVARVVAARLRKELGL